MPGAVPDTSIRPETGKPGARTDKDGLIADRQTADKDLGSGGVAGASSNVPPIKDPGSPRTDDLRPSTTKPGTRVDTDNSVGGNAGARIANDESSRPMTRGVGPSAASFSPEGSPEPSPREDVVGKGSGGKGGKGGKGSSGGKGGKSKRGLDNATADQKKAAKLEEAARPTTRGVQSEAQLPSQEQAAKEEKEADEELSPRDQVPSGGDKGQSGVRRQSKGKGKKGKGKGKRASSNLAAALAAAENKTEGADKPGADPTPTNPVPTNDGPPTKEGPA